MTALRPLRGFALALLAVSVLPVAAGASLLTLRYSGELTSVTDDSPYPAGTPFEGSLTYRSDSAPVFVNGEIAAIWYLNDAEAAVSFSMGETHFTAVATGPADSTLLSLSVYDDFFTACDDVPGPCLSVAPYDAYDFSYAGSQITVLDVSFRTSVLGGDLSAIEGLGIPTRDEELEGLFKHLYYRDPVGEWIVDGRIDSATIVPEPSTLPLCGLALAGLAARSRARRPRRYSASTEPRISEALKK